MLNNNMRELINKIDSIIVNESTGLAGRNPGDVFRNPAGEEIFFNNIRFFPEGGGRFNSDELDEAIQNIEAELGEINWLNNRTGSTGGFGIATFDDPEAQQLFFGRYLNEVKPDPRANYIGNEVNGFKLAGKAAEKAQAGLSPQDLLTKKDNLTVNDIIKELSQSLGTDSPLYQLAYDLAEGKSLPITIPAPEGLSFTAFRDYFCEILQPIALYHGNYTGNAGEAAAIFLGGDFKNTTISFDTTKTAGLSDSIMTTSDGREIKISTKGGAGAKASVKNLLDVVDELSESPAGARLLNKHKEVIDEIREIKAKGQKESPLYLGVKYNVISEKDADRIRSFKNAPLVNLDKVSDLKLSRNLKNLVDVKSPKNPESVNLFYHFLAVVAELAAEKVNTETNFSQAAAEILNNGALVQVYTKAKESNNQWTLTEFNTVYPGESIQGVYISSQKTHYSTDIKGNLTFVIDRGGKKPPVQRSKATTKKAGTRRQPKIDAPLADPVGRAKR